jgi:TRAP-type C4-dicarboxylate transport system substrate-binding protein
MKHGQNKNFQQYLWFLDQIRNGKTAIILSPEFVVVDWKSWRRLNKTANKKQIMFFDEADEVSDEMWKLLEKRIRKTNQLKEMTK